MSLHANQGNGNLRLPEFWPQAPNLWFARAECLFMLRGVTTQLDRFCHVVGSLPHKIMQAFADLVETTPAEDPYRPAGATGACGPLRPERVGQEGG